VTSHVVAVHRSPAPGFIVVDFIPKWADAVQDLVKHIQAGKIKIDDVETVVPARIEDVPEKYKMLFSGSNRGKLITSLASGPASAL
jgi:NADPH-dependent curcumin reductase CurA